MTLGGRWLGVRIVGVRPPRDDVVLTLACGLTIEGVALDAAGHPLANCLVRADGIAIEDRDALVDVIRYPAGIADENGRFEITGLPPGAYRLVALGSMQGKPDPQPLIGAERVAAGAQGLRVTVGQYASISGIVLDENERPMGSALVRAIDLGGTTVSSATTETDGTFTVKRLDGNAVYDLHASIDGRAPSKAAEVASGTTSVRLRLAPGLRASGRVLDGEGAPLKNTGLSFATDASPVRARAKTDDEGRFEVTGLLPGTYRVTWNGVKDNRASSWPCGTIEAGSKDVELRAE